MIEKSGWAEPNFIIGEPRVQKVAGFTYLYVEQKHVEESRVGASLDPLFEKIHAAYKLGLGEFTMLPSLIMFTDIPDQPRWYDVQVGFSVPGGTPPYGEAHVRDVEPTLIASIVVLGNLESVVKSYGPLLEFIKAKGLKDIVGWREWYLYWEGEESMNNVTWVQHLAE
jgi:hypothetical protein